MCSLAVKRGWVVVVHSVMSNSLQPHGLQHASLPCPSPSARFALTHVPQVQPIRRSMSSNHLILCCSLLLLPSIFPRIRIFSSELTLLIRWPNYWSFSFSISFQWIYFPHLASRRPLFFASSPTSFFFAASSSSSWSPNVGKPQSSLSNLFLPPSILSLVNSLSPKYPLHIHNSWMYISSLDLCPGTWPWSSNCAFNIST